MPKPDYLKYDGRHQEPPYDEEKRASSCTVDSLVGLSGGSVFRCVAGCDKPEAERCQITVTNKPPTADEKLYMCPFNHWRSARWEKTPNGKDGGSDEV